MTKRHLYSEKRELWCSQVFDDDPFLFTVHNGAWSFRKNGNTIWIDEIGETQEVDDWVEVTEEEIGEWRKYTRLY